MLVDVVQEAIDEWETIEGGPTNSGPSLAHYIATKIRFCDLTDNDCIVKGAADCFCGNPNVLGVAHRSHECLHIGPQIDV